MTQREGTTLTRITPLPCRFVEMVNDSADLMIHHDAAVHETRHQPVVTCPVSEEVPDRGGNELKFLLDTNLLIRAEPTSPSDLEPGSKLVIDLLRLLSEGHHQWYVHPSSLDEMRLDRNSIRQKTRALLAGKYAVLPAPPGVTPELIAELGHPAPGSHDATDHLLLASVHGDAIDFLVTDDQKLIRKARRIGLGTRVFTPADAIAVVRGLLKDFPSPPPAVWQGPVHGLSEDEPILASFKDDYPKFTSWLRKCKREHRSCWLIRDDQKNIVGVCIVKDEDSNEHGLRGHLLKLCSFKVGDNARGFRYGELLLKAVFGYAFKNKYDYMYVEVFSKYIELIDLFETFGFESLPSGTSKGEIVLCKPLKYSVGDFELLDPLKFHLKFGPKFLKANDVFVVPIRPEYHDMLFPECVRQLSLFPEMRSPYGNSILKAYLSNAKVRNITPGSVLLFYESGGASCVRCLGVVEDFLVSRQPDEIVRFVGKRTVYSLAEIEQMCGLDVLAILFRQAFGILAEPIHLHYLVKVGALKKAPQSIIQVKKKEALKWIRGQIELSP